jgi:hypothetical protein
MPEPKCTHPNLRSFTFKSGETIEMCPEMHPITIDGKIRWYEPCTKGNDNRREVLRTRTKRSA